MFSTLPSPNQSIDIRVEAAKTLSTRFAETICWIYKAWETSKEQTVGYATKDGATGRLASVAKEGHGFSDMFVAMMAVAVDAW